MEPCRGDINGRPLFDEGDAPIESDVGRGEHGRKAEAPARAKQREQVDFLRMIGRLVAASPADVARHMARPQWMEAELELSKKGIAAIGKRGVDELADRTGDIHDKIVMVGLPPVETASVPHFGDKGQILAERPGPLHIDEVDDMFLDVPTKTDMAPLGREFKIDIGICPWKSA